MRGCTAWDDWCAGLRCQNGHRFDYRNGLDFIERGRKEPFTLFEEMPDETVASLARDYVEDPDDEWDKVPKGALAAMKQFLLTRGD